MTLLLEILKLDVEESSTCSHILFAACHDLHYLAHLEPYTGDWFFRNRITLVEGAGFKNEFRKLGFPVTSFPGVFGWSEREVSLSEDDQGSVDSAIKIKGIDKGADPEKRPRDEEDLISLSSRSDSGSKVVISHGRARSGTVEAGPSRPLTNRYLRTSEVPCKYYARVSIFLPTATIIF